MIEKYSVKCTEMLKLCRTCAKNPLNSGKSSSCKDIANGFCLRLQNADKALADFKYWLVDIKTKQMQEEIKKQFAEQKADEERKLAPIENATEKDIEKIEKIETQRQQSRNNFEDIEEPLFSFQPIRN